VTVIVAYVVIEVNTRFVIVRTVETFGGEDRSGEGNIFASFDEVWVG
jgi:hypothetical protein